MRSRLMGAFILLLGLVEAASGQSSPRVFAGAIAGVSTLSADARSVIEQGNVNVSLYKPENGAALNVLAGVYVHEYVALQANYVGNRNDVTLTSVRATGTGPTVVEDTHATRQHAIIGDLLAYFRARDSRLRPYLSVGLGVVGMRSGGAGDARADGAAGSPSPVRATHGVLRVAVGIDVTMGGGWNARYSFSESISSNPLSARLSPPGQRGLANFQNLVGVVRTF